MSDAPNILEWLIPIASICVFLLLAFHKERNEY